MLKIFEFWRATNTLHHWIEVIGFHGTMLKDVPWPIEVMELHGTLLEGVPWPIEGMGLHGNS